jgi:hypothetical protein
MEIMSVIALVEQDTDLVRPLAAIAQDLNDEHRLACAAFQSALQHARRCGELLIEVKERLAHGEFLPWLQTNFEGSKRTAEVYITLARRWPMLEAAANTQRAAHFADLSIRGALAMLAAPQPKAEPIQASLLSDADAFHAFATVKWNEEPYANARLRAQAKDDDAVGLEAEAKRLHAERDELLWSTERTIFQEFVAEHGPLDITPADLTAVANQTATERSAYYTRTAPAEDLRFFLRTAGANMSAAVRVDCELLLTLEPQISRDDFYGRYGVLQDHWRRESNERQQVDLPTTPSAAGRVFAAEFAKPITAQWGSAWKLLKTALRARNRRRRASKGRRP